MIQLGLTALAVAAIGLVGASLGAIHQLYGHLRGRRVARDEMLVVEEAHEVAIAVDELRTELIILEHEVANPPRPVNYRHNLHCPSCGRFARRVFPGDDTVVACKVHEIQVVWKAIPVEWAVEVIGQLEGVPVLQVAAPEPDDLHPPTEPIPIIIADQLSLEQLQEEGAVL